MRIRTRISIWITCAGVIVSLIFSLVVYLEMHEQIFRQLDDELKASARTVIATLRENEVKGAVAFPDAAKIFFNNRNYWVRAWRGGQLVYSSSLAGKIDLPINPEKKKETLSLTISKKIIDLKQDRFDEVTFRTRTVNVLATRTAPAYRIQIALPMEKIDEELLEVTLFIVIGLICSTLLLIFLSYFLAGRILKPVSQVTKMAREIDEKELDVRIPLGESRDELYELSEALNQMLDRLQYSFNRQKEFIASAAHELNTPVTNVRLFIEQSLNRGALPDDFYNDLIRQHEIMLRMGRLLRNLMLLSGLEVRRKIEIAEFDFKAMVESVLADFQPLLTDKEISLQLSLPESLPWSGDEEKLRRVVINLIENAIKYNQVPGEVCIFLKLAAGRLCLEVGNRGKAIPESELEKVFEQFYRVEKSRSLEFGGCGLGLTIVKEIVGLHGGDIRLLNEPEGWIKVVLQLPEIKV
jgi:signal transduction histidine kinase